MVRVFLHPYPQVIPGLCGVPPAPIDDEIRAKNFLNTGDTEANVVLKHTITIKGKSPIHMISVQNTA